MNPTPVPDTPDRADIAHRLRQVAAIMREPDPTNDAIDIEINNMTGEAYDLAADQIAHGRIDGPQHAALLRCYEQLGALADRVAREETTTDQPERTDP
jgi:hypothetical protein